MTKANFAVHLGVLLTASLAGACSFAPPKEVPHIDAGTHFKEMGPWAMAQPGDRLPRDAWWSVYNDAQLDSLEQRLLKNNPDLAAALANYDRARAFTDEQRTGLFPTINASTNVQSLRQSNTAPLRGSGPTYYDSNNVGLNGSYELDLWGQVRNLVASARSLSAAAGADLESARLSLIAQLADTYIALRGFDRDIALLDDTVKAYQRAVDLTMQRHSAGIVPGLDVARAQTILEQAKSQASQSRAQRALAEHTIAALVGESATAFSIAPSTEPIGLPRVPVGVPSALLQRRPDVAAAERRMESANADVGVARAAYFPTFTLSASGGFLSSQRSNWLSAPSSYWALGPQAAVTLLDFGRRKAEVAQARAALVESSDRYRSVALNAFKEVEDNLGLLNHYHDASESEHAALNAAQRSLDFSMDRYRRGASNYLDVVTSQTAALQTQRDALTLEIAQLRASVALVRAVGGGWDDGSMALSEASPGTSQSGS